MSEIHHQMVSVIDTIWVIDSDMMKETNPEAVGDVCECCETATADWPAADSLARRANHVPGTREIVAQRNRFDFEMATECEPPDRLHPRPSCSPLAGGPSAFRNALGPTLDLCV